MMFRNGTAFRSGTKGERERIFKISWGTIWERERNVKSVPEQYDFFIIFIISLKLNPDHGFQVQILNRKIFTCFLRDGSRAKIT